MMIRILQALSITVLLLPIKRLVVRKPPSVPYRAPEILSNGFKDVMASGYSKWPSSKAAASEEARHTRRYVEPLNDARTPLADFFSILLMITATCFPWRSAVLILPHFQRRLKDEHRVIDQITFGVREGLAGQQMPFDRRRSRDKSNQ
jgi:hypothetical protein